MWTRGFIGKLILLCLVMTAPLWGILYVKWPISSDYVFYASILKSFSVQFWASELYPRWLADTNAGLGSPAFLFYSPAAFYVMSLFQFLGPFDPDGFGRIIIGITLALLTAGITSYRWLRRHFEVEDAQRGALLYAAFPYLALHIYGGFAVAQLWGVALFPLLLEAAYDVTQKGLRAIPKFSIAYGLLCMTHLPSVLVFGAIPILYVLVFSSRADRWPYGAVSFFGALLGGCIAAIHLVPALLNKRFIADEHFLDANLTYAQNFLDTYSLLAIVAIVLPLAGFYFEMSKTQRALAMTRPVKFWLWIMAGLLFMTLPLSKPIWDALTPLQYLQFPFRFFFAMLPAAVFVAVCWMPHVRSRFIYQVFFVLGLAAATVQSYETSFFAKKSPIEAILADRLLARPEYQTRWMKQAGADFRIKVPKAYRNLEGARLIEGKGKAAIVMQGPRTIMIHAKIESQKATLVLKRFYFPGWHLAPDTSEAESMRIGHKDALITLALPRGTHDVTLMLPWFAGEREGLIISLFSWVILMTWLALSGLRMTPKNPINDGQSTPQAKS